MQDLFEALYEAAELGDLPTLRALLESDPSLARAADEHGFTALHGAAGEENTEVVDLLLAYGADVNARNDEGASPIHVAVYPDMAAYLIGKGADVDLQKHDGDTPLHTFAGEAECIDVMEVLLEAGADPSVRNARGLLPVDIAASREEHDKVELLESYSE